MESFVSDSDRKYRHLFLIMKKKYQNNMFFVDLIMKILQMIRLMTKQNCVYFKQSLHLVNVKKT